MKSRLSVVALALSTLVAGHALAADASVGKTRDEVRAELAQAIRSGDLIADGATGQRYNELSPEFYAPKAVAVSKTRAEVVAERDAAIRNGDLIADGATGQRYNQLAPAQYAAVRAEAPVASQAAAPVVGKTRAQVKAELAEAIRTGDMVADGATGAKYNELFPQQYPQSVTAQGQARDVRAGVVDSRSANGG
ncbi:DUF4148 domain-containing protein [Hydrogenophaga sp. BPS33]|uniref:DUF4148 domain-containing protein n=1 Tax=Hydrogenophaga sp. BPS33 TaxID=2651974 RepID=UPI001358BB3E|nr:DUF4148 domain-containing protein [Hydrogenophaga sp. BPS33]